MNTSKILTASMIKTGGDWIKAYSQIEKRSIDIEEEECDNLISSNRELAITILDDNYPAELKRIYHPPFALFYRGDLSLLESEKRLSVSGGRNPTQNVVSQLNKVIEELNNDIVIITADSKGCDREVITNAIKNNRKVIMVLASGLDNGECVDMVVKNGGLVITEYPNGIAKSAENCMSRCRIVSALSQSLFVPQTEIRGGAMVSVQNALQFGATIMCFPSENFGVSGCNLLIKEGAILVESAEDIEFNMNRD